MSASILQAVTSRNLLVGVLALGSFVALSNAAEVTGPRSPSPSPRTSRPSSTKSATPAIATAPWPPMSLVT